MIMDPTSAKFNGIISIWVDSIANIFIADKNNYRIRKVSSNTGIITTYAGSGSASYGGDGGLATNAGFSGVRSVWGDSTGIIYVADNQRIRKISSAGIITTCAGGGNAIVSDGYAATNISFSSINYGYLDSSGVIYFIENTSNTIRKIVNGYVYRIASSTIFSDPRGIFVNKNGDTYFVDSILRKVYLVPASIDLVYTLAGNGDDKYTSDGGYATSATLNTPYSVWVDTSDNIYIAENGFSLVRRIYAVADPTIVPTTVPTSRAPTTKAPTKVPTLLPTKAPTVLPTTSSPATRFPTQLPTTIVPSEYPSLVPTANPTVAPTDLPSVSPTTLPSVTITPSPSESPTNVVDLVPSAEPNLSPSLNPSISPTRQPLLPTIDPTEVPSLNPSLLPTYPSSTCFPLILPTSYPSPGAPACFPVVAPSLSPSRVPTLSPTTIRDTI